MAQSSFAKGPRRASAIRGVLWLTFALNIAVAFAKYACGSYTGSAAMQADGIHSIFDSAGNLVGLIGISLAARPADTNHPYGHAKFETFASAIIGLFLLLAAAEVGYRAVERLILGQEPTEVGLLSFVVMAATLAVNVLVSNFERRMAKRYASEVLKADAAHTLSDALVSIGVIIGLGLVVAGFGQADAICALLVMLAILKTAFDVFWQAGSAFSDKARLDAAEIETLVRGFDKVVDTHKIRSRGTQGDIFVDLHVLVDPQMSVLEAHHLADEIELAIERSFDGVGEVLVHLEPVGHEESYESKK